MSTQISPSIPFIQSNRTIVLIHDRWSNARRDKTLPPTTQSTPQFKVYSRRCIVPDTLMPCHEAKLEIMPKSGLDNSSSFSHSSLPIDLVPSDLDFPITLRKGNDHVEIEALKKILAKEFEVKDLGALRSNIAFAVSTVSQYMHSPYEAHMNVVYKILQYLKGTPGKGLHFGKHGQFKIEAFTNAN
ncbi:hypothetical protein CK203_020545 [Vitis vinifera]|uniref:Retrovirus-related Pol polyprotein from transposon RE1 n=1 Tax=Vitis vinifera TaxID=29760 RepID=A0A438FMC7_VITVI|nr:hypothetical protein CK203_020545 [Vitis vinifera]